MVTRGFILALLVSLSLSTVAMAQRTAHQWVDPGTFHSTSVGGNLGGGGGGFSSSVGGLSRTGAYGGGSSLGSSSLTIPRLAGSPGSSAMSSGFSPISTPSAAAVSHLPGLGPVTNNFDPAAPGVVSNDMGGGIALKPYLIALGYSTDLTDDEEISSFVPVEPSIFQTQMRQAEVAFRHERYEDAESACQMALALARHAPETHLGLMQSYVALGKYNMAAFHLEKALGYYPELPLTRLALRKFYSNNQEFVDQLESLRREALDANSAGKVSLVLAFFYYFDGSDKQAIEALKRAQELAEQAKDGDTLQAVDIFWNGVVAAGRGAGTIQNASQPTSRPARGPAGPEIRLNSLLNSEPPATSQP